MNHNDNEDTTESRERIRRQSDKDMKLLHEEVAILKLAVDNIDTRPWLQKNAGLLLATVVYAITFTYGYGQLITAVEKVQQELPQKASKEVLGIQLENHNNRIYHMETVHETDRVEHERAVEKLHTKIDKTIDLLQKILIRSSENGNRK